MFLIFRLAASWDSHWTPNTALKHTYQFLIQMSAVCQSSLQEPLVFLILPLWLLHLLSECLLFPLSLIPIFPDILHFMKYLNFLSLLSDLWYNISYWSNISKYLHFVCSIFWSGWYTPYSLYKVDKWLFRLLFCINDWQIEEQSYYKSLNDFSILF